MNGPIKRRMPSETEEVSWYRRFIFFQKSKWDKLEDEYLKELVVRKFDKDPWEGRTFNKYIRDTIVAILKQCWGHNVQFHPDDDYFVIGFFQTGDLSELEIVMDIEDALKIKIKEEDHEKYFTGTLINLIDLIDHDRQIEQRIA